MVSYASRRQKAKLKTAGAGKRVMVVFGPPACGVSTVIDTLKAASETAIAIVPYVGPTSVLQAEEALEHAEVVFLDVDGGLFGPKDVQTIVDHRLVFTGSGAMVRMYAPDETILSRAEKRPGYASVDDLREWNLTIPPVEEKIRQHILSYFMVPNIDLEEAVKQLALRAGVIR